MLRTFYSLLILNIRCRKYFVCFVFVVVAQAYENILTTKISRFMVCDWVVFHTLLTLPKEQAREREREVKPEIDEWDSVKGRNEKQINRIRLRYTNVSVYHEEEFADSFLDASMPTMSESDPVLNIWSSCIYVVLNSERHRRVKHKCVCVCVCQCQHWRGM